MTTEEKIKEVLLWIVSPLVVAFVVGFLVGATSTKQLHIKDACGPCDHVAECGSYRCEAGKEGWRVQP